MSKAMPDGLEVKFNSFIFSRPNDPQCQCNDGYGGPDCSKPDVNECKYRPCSIHAECTNTLGSFTCACREGKKTSKYWKLKLFCSYILTLISASNSLKDSKFV